jgi:hypothetical protein
MWSSSLGLLSAYNARAFGVRDYIAQLMFNSPPGSERRDGSGEDAGGDGDDSPPEPLRKKDRGLPHLEAVRIGLLSHPLDPDAARGHLAASTYLQMALKPHICTSSATPRRTTPPRARTSSKPAKSSAARHRERIAGAPDMTADPEVQAAASTNWCGRALPAGSHPRLAAPGWPTPGPTPPPWRRP